MPARSSSIVAIFLASSRRQGWLRLNARMECLSLSSRIPTLTVRRSTAPVTYSDVGIPPSNRSINRGAEDRGWFARSQQKICLTSVEDSAGWCARQRLLVYSDRLTEL